MMVRKSFIAASILMSVANPTFAADAVMGGPAEPPAAEIVPAQFSWSGGYAGILTGYGWADVKPSDLELSADGARVGAFAGYNFEIGNNLFLGAEAELAYDWNQDTSIVSGQTFTISSGLSGAARARLAYGADRALFYLAGGYAVTELNGESSVMAKQDKTMHGWTVGAGADYAVTDRIITRVEYRYTDFGDVTFPGDTEAVSLKQHAVNVGLAVKF
ncbi:outer membrane protein [Allorhizobium sp. NPDC080224]|nr:outer membrane protein [Rhizobium rosettiformans]